MPDASPDASRAIRHIGGLCLLGMVLLAGAATVWALDDGWAHPAALADWLRAKGAWGAVMVIGLMIAHCFAPFPAELVALCAGAVYGVAGGTALVWIGAMLGAALSFAISRWLGRAAVERMTPERHRARLARLTREQGALALLVARLIPVIAFNLINYAAGLTQVRWSTFLWTTGLGILPITLLTTWLGAEMRDLSWPTLLGVSAACILGVLLLRMAMRRL